ncbi:hypothetical protein V6R21_25425 [Limibacter armeniacum]|uniref:hypothetical protein n=1 Tax=Limibacter armeniacum TaxID=466084 RepID=UPI002FE63164
MRTHFVTKLLMLGSFAVLLLSGLESHAQMRTRKQLHTGIKIGSQGIGIEVEKSLRNNFAISANVNYLNISLQKDKDVLKYNILAQVEAETLSAGVFGHYYFHKSSRHAPLSLKATAGINYNLINNYAVKGINDNNVNIGEMTLTPEEMGYIAVQVNTSQVMPYLGIGSSVELVNIRALRRKHWFILNPFLKNLGLNLDVGAFYHGKASITDMEATNYLSPNVSQEAVLNDNLSQYRLYPNLALRIHYTFNLF